MTCRMPREDWYPPDGWEWPADELSEAWLSPTKRPVNHQNPDNAPEGALEFVTAHRVRVEPVPLEFEEGEPDYDTQTHLCYGQVCFRNDGTCYVRMPSQMNLSHDSRAWHEGTLTFQAEDDGVIPEGCCGIFLEYTTPWAVEHRYDGPIPVCEPPVS